MHTVWMNLKNAMLRKKPGTIDHSRLFTWGSGTGKMNYLGPELWGIGEWWQRSIKEF